MSKKFRNSKQFPAHYSSLTSKVIKEKIYDNTNSVFNLLGVQNTHRKQLEIQSRCDGTNRFRVRATKRTLKKFHNFTD